MYVSQNYVSFLNFYIHSSPSFIACSFSCVKVYERNFPKYWAKAIPASLPEGNSNPQSKSMAASSSPLLRLALVPSIMAASLWITMGTSLSLSPYVLQILMTVKAVIILVRLAICLGQWQFQLKRISLLSVKIAHAECAEIKGLLKVIYFRIPQGSSQFCQYMLFRSGLRLDRSILILRSRTGLTLEQMVLPLIDRCFFRERYCLRLVLMLVMVLDMLVVCDSMDMGRSEQSDMLCLSIGILLKAPPEQRVFKPKFHVTFKINLGNMMLLDQYQACPKILVFYIGCTQAILQQQKSINNRQKQFMTDPNHHDDSNHDFLALLNSSRLGERSVCWHESNDSTREENYEEFVNYKAHLRKLNGQLRAQIQRGKNQLVRKYLEFELKELESLSTENKKLREQYQHILYETNKPKHMPHHKDTHKDIIRTPRSRKSIVNHYESQRGSRIQQQNQLSGRKSLVVGGENQRNCQGNGGYGRNSLKSPRAMKRNQSGTNQMTQRKNYMHSRILGCNNAFSEYGSRKSSMRPSLENNQVRSCEKNVFLHLINTILQQQKLKEEELKELEQDEQWDLAEMGKSVREERVFVDDISKEIMKTNQNIDNLTKILSKYESEITDMNINLNDANKMTKELFTLKGEFLKMQVKCSKISDLKKQTKLKQDKLKFLQDELGVEHINFSIKPPESVKMMLRVYGIEEKRIANPSLCKQEVRKLVKGKLDKPSKKKQKIRELFDTIRESRRKFKQLMTIYNGRIQKMEIKINNYRLLESRRRGH